MRAATAADAVFFAAFAFSAALLGQALLADLTNPDAGDSAADRLVAGQQQAAARANATLDAWANESIGAASAGTGELARGEGEGVPSQAAN